MTFNILDHLDRLIPEGRQTQGEGSFHCPACGSPNFKVNLRNSKYNTFGCDCASNDQGKRKIRQAIAHNKIAQPVITSSPQPPEAPIREDGHLYHSPPLLNERDLLDLANSGLSPEAIALTQHRTVNPQQAKNLIGYSLPGLLLQYHDIEGHPYEITQGKPFLRIKPHWAEVNGSWPGERPKYLSPKGAGCRPYFSRLQDDWGAIAHKPKQDLIETEGEKKADSACHHGFPTIGFSGVDCWRDSRESPSGQLPELDIIEWNGRQVFQCYDSDIISKDGVQRATYGRATKLQELGAKPFLILLPNEIDGRKNGLDDFLKRHGSEAFQRLKDIAEPSLKSTKGTPSLNLPTDPSLYTKILMSWAIFKEEWAYRPGAGWYRWNSTHWELRDKEELNSDLIRFMDAQLWKTRDSKTTTSLEKELRGRLLIEPERWNQSAAIAFHNGVLDTEFREHRRNDYSTTCLPFDYNPEATCPQWLTFLDRVTAGDSNLVAMIRAMFRWVLVPKDGDRKFPIERFFILKGPPGSGKGTTLDILAELLGPTFIGSGSPETFDSPEELGALLDKRLALDSDASGFLKASGTVSKIVSNEPVLVRRRYHDPVFCRLGVVIIMALNEHLATPRGSNGLDRRAITIPFDHAIPESQRDPYLSSKLQTELPGIFLWAWTMENQTMMDLLLQPNKIERIREANQERQEYSNPELNFLQEFSPNGGEYQPSFLYSEYREWCKTNGYQNMGRDKFLGTLCDRYNCTRRRVGGTGQRLINVPVTSSDDQKTAKDDQNTAKTDPCNGNDFVNVTSQALDFPKTSHDVTPSNPDTVSVVTTVTSVTLPPQDLINKREMHYIRNVKQDATDDTFVTSATATSFQPMTSRDIPPEVVTTPAIAPGSKVRFNPKARELPQRDRPSPYWDRISLEVIAVENGIATVKAKNWLVTREYPIHVLQPIRAAPEPTQRP